jgi:hypothetical protein
MISNGKDRLKKTLWLRSQARAISGHYKSQQQLNPDVLEFWFSDFARRSEFDRVIRELAAEQRSH